jgi:hypothetical protein
MITNTNPTQLNPLHWSLIPMLLLLLLMLWVTRTQLHNHVSADDPACTHHQALSAAATYYQMLLP